MTVPSERDAAFTVSGDADHVYISDEFGEIIRTFDAAETDRALKMAREMNVDVVADAAMDARHVNPTEHTRDWFRDGYRAALEAQHTRDEEARTWLLRIIDAYNAPDYENDGHLFNLIEEAERAYVEQSDQGAKGDAR